jgi:TPR repeat protein
LIYDEGKGVPNNYNTAIKFLTLAADKGHAEAQYSLGSMYGSYTPGELAAAFKWFTLATEQGYAHAQLTLARMF